MGKERSYKLYVVSKNRQQAMGNAQGKGNNEQGIEHNKGKNQCTLVLSFRPVGRNPKLLHLTTACIP